MPPQASNGLPNGFAYVSNPPHYNPHIAQAMPPGSHPGQQPGQHQQQQYPYTHHPQPPQHPQVQQAYMQEQRRQSMPPAFPQQERSQQHQRNTPSPPQPEIERHSHELQPQQPKPMPAKSRSIFTPIDDSRSLLAQHWGIGTTTAESRHDHIKVEKDNRSQSIDVGSVQRSNGSIPTPPPPAKVQRPPQPIRGQSLSSIAGDGQGAKRPRLKVQIPSEQSDDGGSATAASSPGGTTGTPAKASTDASHSSAVVLPPPSPSAGALLSAGAQGPPNPFARPHPPMNATNQNNQAYNNNNNNNIETPISALPSRFVADGLLPSPSSFYPEWGFGRAGGDSNTLPSPLNFQTPVVSNGPSFLRDEDGERKRKSPEGDGQQETGSLKRVKA